MKKDYIAELRERLRAYHKTEHMLIATNPTLFEADEENYSDSYKWLRFPIPGEQSETVSDMILSGFEDFPNDCLAEILAVELRNLTSKGICLDGLSIDRIGSSFQFCISGSTSLEELRTLCEQYLISLCSAGEK